MKRYGLQIEFDTDDDVGRAQAREWVRDVLATYSQHTRLVRNVRIKYVHEATTTQDKRGSRR